MDNKNLNLLPTLCHLCGMKPTRNLRRFNYSLIMTRLESMYILKNSGGGTGFSPLHLATQGEEAGGILKDVHINLVDGMYISVNFIIAGYNVIVLPRTSAARNIARIWAYIVRHALSIAGNDYTFNKFTYILVNPSKITPEETQIGEIDLSEVDEETLKSTYEAFIAAALTDDETDFDIEIELQGIKTRSMAARQRIKRRMQKMGLKVLRGTKASIYLRNGSSRCTVDLKKLESEFPDAYKKCVKGAKHYEFLTIKLNDTNDK